MLLLFACGALFIGLKNVFPLPNENNRSCDCSNSDLTRELPGVLFRSEGTDSTCNCATDNVPRQPKYDPYDPQNNERYDHYDRSQSGHIRSYVPPISSQDPDKFFQQHPKQSQEIYYRQYRSAPQQYEVSTVGDTVDNEPSAPGKHENISAWMGEDVNDGNVPDIELNRAAERQIPDNGHHQSVAFDGVPPSPPFIIYKLLLSASLLMLPQMVVQTPKSVPPSLLPQAFPLESTRETYTPPVMPPSPPAGSNNQIYDMFMHLSSNDQANVLRKMACESCKENY